MAETTRWIQLRISNDMTADSKFNLRRIDESMRFFSSDAIGGFYIKADRGVFIHPSTTANYGGVVEIGQRLKPVEYFTVWGPFRSLGYSITNTAGKLFTLSANELADTDVQLFAPAEAGLPGYVLGLDEDGQTLKFIDGAALSTGIVSWIGELELFGWTDGGDEYRYLIPAATHKQGNRLLIQTYQEDSGKISEVLTDWSIEDSGDVILAVAKVPDSRFMGLVSISRFLVVD